MTKRTRTLLRMAATLLAGVLALGLLLLLLYVDDWNRDLHSNEAATDALAADPLLRPISTPHNVARVAQEIQNATANLPRWQLAEQHVTQSGATLRYVHYSTWLRFVQDVTVYIARHDLGSIVTVESKSRAGWADLGQNPRNIRQLHAAVRKQLDSLGIPRPSVSD